MLMFPIGGGVREDDYIWAGKEGSKAIWRKDIPSRTKRKMSHVTRAW